MLQRPHNTLIQEPSFPKDVHPALTQNGPVQEAKKLFQVDPSIVDPQMDEAVSLGTTILAVSFKDGVILAADSRTSSGSYVVNRCSNKLTKLTKKIYCCRSGSAADTQSLAEITSNYLERYEIDVGAPAGVPTAATLFQKLCYMNKWNISAGIIVAGYDTLNGGCVYSIPSGGSCVKLDYALGGSGSIFLYSFFDNNYKPGMTKDECLRFCQKAVAHAYSRDGSSGGLVRTIVLSAGEPEDMTVPWTKAPYLMQQMCDVFYFPTIMLSLKKNFGYCRLKQPRNNAQATYFIQLSTLFFPYFVISHKMSGRIQNSFRNGLIQQYVRLPPRSFTEACEAPVNMWSGAIPLRQMQVRKNGVLTRVVRKTYEHPKEINPPQLHFNDIDSVYCLGNHELVRFFPEGLGGKVMQLMPPGHPRGFLYRKESHLLNCFIDKLQFWQNKREAIKTLTNNRPGFILDGPTGCGKSALLCQAVHYARSRGLMTVYIPNAKSWTHGEWCWPSTILPGFFDAPDAAREFLKHFAIANRQILKSWRLIRTPKDLPTEPGESAPKNLLDLCEWGHRAVAPASIDRQSVCLKFFFDEISAEQERPIVFVVDGWNLLSHNTHFRFPHPDFFRNLSSFNDGTSDVDLYPQEFPRIPSSRLSIARGLNKIILSKEPNKFFIVGTTRDFKPFDGVAGFPDVENDRFASSLDEYTPYDAEKDSFFHPISVQNFTEYEFRAFLRFVINSGELAGLGWGPMWHHSSDFERKLYKIGFLSDRNPQRVIDHYHQELVWKFEYQRCGIQTNKSLTLRRASRRNKEALYASSFPMHCKIRIEITSCALLRIVLRSYALCNLFSHVFPFFLVEKDHSLRTESVDKMARTGKRHQSVVQRNFDSLKAFYGVPPMPTSDRVAHPPFYMGAYSRRGVMGSYHIVGAPREQLTFDAMRTYAPATSAKPVVDLFLEVAALVSVYYDTLDHDRFIDCHFLFAFFDGPDS
eukprot:gene12101-8325_t